MLKYLYTKVVFAEVPDEITLGISFSGCPIRCKGCHSPELWNNDGTYMSFEELDKLILSNEGITCVGLFGGDQNPTDIYMYARHIKKVYNLKVAWYSGRKEVPHPRYYNAFDYIKVGPYIEALGGLTSPITNQKFYKVIDNKLINITYKFNGTISETKNICTAS